MAYTLQNKSEVKKPLEVWQGVVGLFVIMSIVMGLYGSSISEVKATATKQQNHEDRITTLEADRVEMKRDLRETKEMVTEIRIIVKSQDQKK